MKALGSIWELRSKLAVSSIGEGGGIPGVEVKFVDIRRNIGGEGGRLDDY